MTLDGRGALDDVRSGSASGSRGLRAVIAVAGGALLLILVGLLVPRACPPLMQIVTDPNAQCVWPDYRPAVALAAAVVVILGGTTAAAAATRPATSQNRRALRNGVLVASIGSVLGLMIMLVLASGLALGAPR